MGAIQRILFPVDLTAASENLIPHVLTMVDKFNARLHVLFVVRSAEYTTLAYEMGSAVSLDLFQTGAVEGARAKMDEFIQVHFADRSNIQSDVMPGDPYDAILHYINDKKIDMVVMGTHGRKGLGRVIFGSVAERVIKWAHVPILVINPLAPKE